MQLCRDFVLFIAFFWYTLYLFYIMQDLVFRVKLQFKKTQVYFLKEQSLHLTISVFMYESMISKHHGIFWNLQDLLSICLDRGDRPVHFAYRTASEGFMVTEKRAKLFCTSNYRNMVHWSLSPFLSSILEMSRVKKDNS